METALFDFELPDSSIAQEPAFRRDHSRLLHVKHNEFSDRQVLDIVDLLDHNDVLVLNNTRVIPARLFGKRDNIDIEILLHKQIEPLKWRVFAKPAKRVKIGQSITFSADICAQVLDKHESGEVLLQFLVEPEHFWNAIELLGQMPLPPYISREEGATAIDEDRYQTVYATHNGSVAAPTAGLHFTDALLEQLADRGVDIQYVTLHVGGGTFLPVKSEDTKDHVMHSEFGIVSDKVAQALNTAKSQGKNIIAVGTTSLRILESTTDESGVVHPFNGETDIFITPGYKFRCVDRLLTNFHLPKSTLFMLVSAFSGLSRMQSAYKHAIRSGYRFYSYGDACLLERSSDNY